MLESVRRDLEDLLNTRRTPPDGIQDEELLRDCILNYGLPDLTGVQAITPQQSARTANAP